MDHGTTIIVAPVSGVTLTLIPFLDFLNLWATQGMAGTSGLLLLKMLHLSCLACSLVVLDLFSQSLSSLLSLAIAASPKPFQSLDATCLVLHLTLRVLPFCLLAPLVSGDPEDDLVLRPLGSSGSESDYLVVLTALILDV